MISSPLLRVLSAAVLAATLGLTAFTAGAHGPEGDHAHAPTGPATSAAQPRVEAHSDLFELVATLHDGELSLLIDRYATNEPVLRARVELESGGLKAQATFHEDHGDYAVTDAAMLKRLGTPGEHALVITVIHGNDSDLLDATLRTATADGGHEVGSPRRWPWVAAAIAALLLGTAAVLRRRAAGRARQGGLA